ncbi:MAG: apolipoprotein N-acyltransferase, partial [Gemmatimonadales bacterium]
VALSAGAGILVGYGLLRMGRLPMATAAEVGVVATGIPFDATQEAIQEARDSALSWTADLAGRGVVAIVGPEAPAPGVSEVRATDSARARIARESGVPILAGALQPVPGEPGAMFNAMLWFAPLPEEDTVYRKRRLVPLVEGSGTREGSAAPLLATRSGQLGVLICFESVFEDMARTYRRAGAGILINATNDAWGEGTSGPAQHALHLALRAVETRAAVIRVSNRGVSFAVDPLGRVIEVHERPGAYVMRVPLSDTVPPYVRWGDWVGMGSVILVAGGVVVSGRGGALPRPSRDRRA